jgi:hypothetical protein
MAVSDTLPVSLKTVVENGVLNRLPLTFLPFANQQLRDWQFCSPMSAGPPSSFFSM